ncbi:protein translocase subunit SecF [Acidiferrobacter thiooxydans]|jgi:preprotein translocase subunit SecF|uniref:Protein-export membrane protein SecF n=1 Tax=Acidiferrobacter thiooxydans TaxID=163359 RepID=A0A1C2G1W3_9GAMM|nr:protein translocase subunit SecF [Acidiferrobacter thiooxydans]MDA8191064.1 protein translocase subunit SecF [Gammaproteobacteria bacterium]RCN59040.1 protein translocase subunit SecF [Acidiferrobacter thiooxydans]UEO00791.1 protein translocase subunit SecF [Acidiferrobacter thiooxydans]
MEFFRIKRDLPFMRYARTTVFVSLVFFAVAVAALIARGLNLNVDFTGGTVIELQFKAATPPSAIRRLLMAHHYHHARVENYGTASKVLIRLPTRATKGKALAVRVLRLVSARYPGASLRSVEYVGPEVGSELADQGALALLFVALGITIYLTLRFEWRFAVGAIVATIHDVVIVLGVFALFHISFSLTVLAAILAVLGYSVNDTVVVFDRIRENFRRMRTGTTAEVIDSAITRTLSRTVMTHLLTQMMVLSMLFLGGPVLFGFALAMTVGIVVGTYGSVLVASPIVMWLGLKREDLVARKAAAERP